MKNFYCRIYGSKEGETLKEVALPTYCTAENADRCAEVLLMTLPESVQALPKKLIIAKEIALKTVGL
jgi:hypothetical protein